MYQTTTYIRTRLPQKELLKKVEQLIETEVENTIKNHYQGFGANNDNKIFGNKALGVITLWRTNATYSGVFYPIFINEIQSTKEGSQIKLITKFNPLAAWIVTLISVVLIFGIFKNIIIQENNELYFLFTRTLIGSILYLIILSVPLYSFWDMKRQTLKGLKTYLNS